jgi:RNA polymerase sigma-70 factor, ECF subfamily
MNGRLAISIRTETMNEGGPAPTPGDAARWLRAIASSGDRAAFVALFHHFAPRVKAYLLRLGLPAARAEDLAQETMLMVWRKAARFDPDTAGAAAWIFTIARNLRIDAARHDSLVANDRDPLEDAPPPPPADALLDAEQRARRLHAALAHLPSEQADVVRLSFFDDRPHAEIERALGIPLGTVKSRLRLAMSRLRGLLEDLT